MNRKELINLVSFVILMQGNDGIMGKAPSYIIEKYETRHPFLLDSYNKALLQAWMARWSSHIPEGDEE